LRPWRTDHAAARGTIRAHQTARQATDEII
jgi:hypothetical protein